MWFIWLPFLVLMVWGIVKFNEKYFFRNSRNSPLEILKNRYAKGEINTDEYLEKKKLLEE